MYSITPDSLPAIQITDLLSPASLHKPSDDVRPGSFADQLRRPTAPPAPPAAPESTGRDDPPPASPNPSQSPPTQGAADTAGTGTNEDGEPREKEPAEPGEVDEANDETPAVGEAVAVRAIEDVFEQPPDTESVRESTGKRTGPIPVDVPDLGVDEIETPVAEVESSDARTDVSGKPVEAVIPVGEANARGAGQRTADQHAKPSSEAATRLEGKAAADSAPPTIVAAEVPTTGETGVDQEERDANQRGTEDPTDVGVAAGPADVAVPTLDPALRDESASKLRSQDSPGNDDHKKEPAGEGVRRAEGERPGHALASRLGEQLITRGSTRGEQASGAREIDPSRLVQRVVRAFQTATTRGEPLRIRLHPPELGALKLEIKVQSGVMSARLETETHAARSILMEHLPTLRDRLAEQGIRVEQFDIDLHERMPGGTQEGTADQQRQQQGQTEPRRPLSSEAAESDALPMRSRLVPNRNGLNVVI